MNTVTIVDCFRAPGKTVLKKANTPSLTCVKTSKYIPFPPGTIKGPFVCGKGTDPKGGVQYAVNQKDGSWVYFIRASRDSKQAKKDAEEFSKKVLSA